MTQQAISSVKAHLAEVIERVRTSQEPVTITQNGFPGAILQDPATYEQTRLALQLFKAIALGEQDISQGKCSEHSDVFRTLKSRLSKTPSPSAPAGLAMQVLWAAHAVRDLKTLITATEPSQQLPLLQRLEDKSHSLYGSPLRNRMVPELHAHGLVTYRELLIPPWRLLYRVKDSSVHVISLQLQAMRFAPA